MFVFSKGAIQKYVSVLQRYFVQYLDGFDVAVLKEVVQVCMLHVHVTDCFVSKLHNAIIYVALVELYLRPDV